MVWRNSSGLSIYNFMDVPNLPALPECQENKPPPSHPFSTTYCFQVPANRIGSYEFSTAQLKTIQEVITLVVFCIFSVFYLKEELKWNYVVGFLMMIGAVFFVFKKW
jgi:hypothetical protein